MLGYYTVPTALKRCYPSGQYVRSSMHLFAFHEMYGYVLRTNDGPKSASFWTPMHVDNGHSPADFYPYRQRP